jgi:glycerol-3-phosphate acyltransferase PlsY
VESIGLEFGVVIMAIVTYFFASIPFGLLLSKLFGLGDIRNIGSGNIGATNVLRTGNKKAAIFTLLFDCLKGALPVLLCKYILPGHEYSIGFLAVFAHIFSIYLKFRGGKGVATALGVYLAWNWVFGVCILVIWLVTAKLFKISSLAALIAAVSAPLIIFVLKLDLNIVPYSVLIAALILFTHRDNIKRIINKKESSISI